MRQIERGIPVTPLFQAPFVTTKTFRRDWLHSVDLGIAADFLGSLFRHLIVRHMPGNNRTVKTAALWDRILDFYEAHGTQDRLRTLVWNGIQASAKKPPKLKGNAACVKALVPFARTISAELFLDANNEEENAMKEAAVQLDTTYRCLRSDDIFWKDVCFEAGVKFCQLVAALAANNNGVFFRVKPKMHMFLEMLLQGSKVCMSWTYRDEDYGGTMARLARSRGSARKSAYATSRNVLTSFKYSNPVARIL